MPAAEDPEGLLRRKRETAAAAALEGFKMLGQTVPKDADLATTTSEVRARGCARAH